HEAGDACITKGSKGKPAGAGFKSRDLARSGVGAEIERKGVVAGSTRLGNRVGVGVLANDREIFHTRKVDNRRLFRSAWEFLVMNDTAAGSGGDIDKTIADAGDAVDDQRVAGRWIAGIYCN